MRHDGVVILVFGSFDPDRIEGSFMLYRSIWALVAISVQHYGFIGAGHCRAGRIAMYCWRKISVNNGFVLLSVTWVYKGFTWRSTEVESSRRV